MVLCDVITTKHNFEPYWKDVVVSLISDTSRLFISILS